MTNLRKRMLEELQRRNYSPATIRGYLRAVEQFAKHFGKSPDKLGPDELRSYQAYLLTERKLAVGSVVARVAALRFFFVRTLKRREFREELPYPKDRRRLPTVLSLEEVARLIDAAGNLTQRALLMTLYGTGMRRTEVSLLKVSDIDSRRMMIRVERGKGGAGRDLPLSPALLETLREYWRWKKPRTYLFPSSTGHHGPDKPISDKTVWYACKEAALHARITKHVTPHTLRHSWAIIYRVPVIESDSNIKVVSWCLRNTWRSLISLSRLPFSQQLRPPSAFPQVSRVGCLVLLSANFSCDELAKPDMCGVVVPLAVPHHPQDEGRQSEGLGAGPQVEACAESLNNRFLDACHEVTRRDGVQHRQAMRERQSQAATKSSCSELVIDQPP